MYTVDAGANMTVSMEVKEGVGVAVGKT